MEHLLLRLQNNLQSIQSSVTRWEATSSAPYLCYFFIFSPLVTPFKGVSALLSCELTSLSSPFRGPAPPLAGLHGRSHQGGEGQRKKSSVPLSNSGLEIHPFLYSCCESSKTINKWRLVLSNNIYQLCDFFLILPSVSCLVMTVN